MTKMAAFVLLSVATSPCLSLLSAIVPLVGSAQASLCGPSSMEVTWALAYSGGLPVLYFELQLQKLNDTDWRKPRSPCNTSLISRQSRFSASAVVAAHFRLWIVNGLESEELYIFRVRAVNELGEGEYVTSEPVLSHPIGKLQLRIIIMMHITVTVTIGDREKKTLQ